MTALQELLCYIQESKSRGNKVISIEYVEKKVKEANEIIPLKGT